jgi:hypothetical protein
MRPEEVLSLKMDATMRKALLSLLIISFVLLCPPTKGQIPVSVSDPRIEIEDNIIHIYYDILNSTPEIQFKINIEITDADGNVIKARALKGDIGKDVPGGNNKHIEWNLEEDKIFLNAAIYFEINATYVPPPEPVVVQPEVSRQFTRTSLILQSIAIPGLGLSRITDKPHWIRGAIGYGSLAGSLIFNLQARNTYESIEDYPEYDDKQNLFDLSVSQDIISDLLGFTAIGIWAMDFIWTMVGTSDLKMSSMKGSTRGLSVGGGLDPMTYTPTVRVRYRF